MPRAEDTSGLASLQPTVYHVNRMTSMNVLLEMRVLDTVGLTTPLAARQPRDPTPAWATTSGCRMMAGRRHGGP